MSKGPGRCQRNIITALKRKPAVELRTLLGKGATRSQVVALKRAAKVLEAKGVIGVLYFSDWPWQLSCYLLHRPSYNVEANAKVHGLKKVTHPTWGDHYRWERDRP
jgi:hypothetical protein